MKICIQTALQTKLSLEDNNQDSVTATAALTSGAMTSITAPSSQATIRARVAAFGDQLIALTLPGVSTKPIGVNALPSHAKKKRVLSVLAVTRNRPHVEKASFNTALACGCGMGVCELLCDLDHDDRVHCLMHDR